MGLHTVEVVYWQRWTYMLRVDCQLPLLSAAHPICSLDMLVNLATGFSAFKFLGLCCLLGLCCPWSGDRLD
jgi:hypothetical protein